MNVPSVRPLQRGHAGSPRWAALRLLPISIDGTIRSCTIESCTNKIIRRIDAGKSAPRFPARGRNGAFTGPLTSSTHLSDLPGRLLHCALRGDVRLDEETGLRPTWRPRAAQGDTEICGSRRAVQPRPTRRQPGRASPDHGQPRTEVVPVGLP